MERAIDLMICSNQRHEPLADEEWLKNYRREQAENEELEKELTKCFNNSMIVADW